MHTSHLLYCGVTRKRQHDLKKNEWRSRTQKDNHKRHEGFNDDDEIGNKVEPRTCNLRSIELPLKVKNIILNACYIRKFKGTATSHA